MESSAPFDTLFLDRDGVINVHRPDDYVKSVAEFVFLPGVLQALRLLSPLFLRILVVTNQRGVGKGLMSVNELDGIHRYMTAAVEANHGRIDKIYCCTDTDPHSLNRKPNTGMMAQACRDYPSIDPTNSRMVGDSLSDILFAKNAGLPAVLVGNRYSREEIAPLGVCAHYADLLTFARQLNHI